MTSRLPRAVTAGAAETLQCGVVQRDIQSWTTHDDSQGCSWSRLQQTQQNKMESKRSRTIVSTTITTEPSSNEDSPSTEALQHQINDLTHQISLLQSKTDELAQMVRTIRAPGQDVHRRDDPADGPLALKHLNRPVQACNCQCTSHDARPNTIGR